MNVEYTVYEKYYLTTSECKVNHLRSWYVGIRTLQEPDHDIF